MCCIALTGLLTCLFVNNPASSLITGATALVGVSNLYLLAESTNYFSADASYNTFLQTWSLGVEEQFYLCFPVLAWWLFQRRGKGGSTANAVSALDAEPDLSAGLHPRQPPQPHRRLLPDPAAPVGAADGCTRPAGSPATASPARHRPTALLILSFG